MPTHLDDDMRAVINSARLVFAATVTPDGKPNLSPKGTIRVFDQSRLFFLDIASPRTRANLRHSPFIELNVVDQTSRRGYRFFGRATLHQGDEVFSRATKQIFAEENAVYPAECVVLIDVERAEPLVSPGYWHVADEWDMRAEWKRRRPILDAEFEDHVRRRGPWRESR
jgi:predicted pyridoxine 5'-phosphate oxidase superfamily flavin-nucleotide-binding protein